MLKNEKDFKVDGILKKSSSHTADVFKNLKPLATVLHNKVDLFNSHMINTNITKLREALNLKNNFLLKFEENQKKKFNDFIFDPNIDYNIEKSKLEKVSNIKGINWSINANDNLNIEKNKGLGIIKLKQSQKEARFLNSSEKPKLKKVNFKEDHKEGKAKKVYKATKLISDRKIFTLGFINNENPEPIKLVDKASKDENEESKKIENPNPQSDEKMNLFISHFLCKVDSPSPKKKLKRSPNFNSNDEIKGDQLDSLNKKNSENSLEKIQSFELDNQSNNNEKHLTAESNQNNIVGKKLKFEGIEIEEERDDEKNIESDKDDYSFDKKDSLINQSLNNNENKNNEELPKNKFLSQLEEKLNYDKNINNLYLNDFLTSSPKKNGGIDLNRNSMGVFNFGTIKNSIFNNTNIINLDLTKKEDKNLIANKLQSLLFGTKENKLLFSNSYNNCNSLYSNEKKNTAETADDNYMKNNSKDNLIFEIRNSKIQDFENSYSSDILNNLNDNIRKESLFLNNDEKIKRKFKRHPSKVKSYNNLSNAIMISPKSTSKFNENVLPILNKILPNQKSNSPTRRNRGSIFNNAKKTKKNLIPTLSQMQKLSIQTVNKIRIQKGKNFFENQNLSNIHNKVINSGEPIKIIEGSNSQSLSKSPSRGKKDSKSKNKEESEISSFDSMSVSDSNEAKDEEQDEFDDNFDTKVLEHLKIMKKITVESPRKRLKGRKFTIYDKDILKFFDKKIKNEKHAAEVNNIYAKIFGMNLESILELKKYPARIENQTKSNKNIERRKFSEKNYVNKYICDMKEKIHFMKGLLDFSYARVICDKVRIIADNVKKENLKKKLKKIKSLSENEIQEVIQYMNDLKDLKLGELVSESENEEDKNQEEKINKKNSMSSYFPNPKKFKPIEKIYTELISKIEKVDKRLKESLKEVSNESIQSYLRQNKKIANRANSVISSNISKYSSKKELDPFNDQIKYSNLFESLPNFNNTIYRNSFKIDVNDNQSKNKNKDNNKIFKNNIDENSLKEKKTKNDQEKKEIIPSPSIRPNLLPPIKRSIELQKHSGKIGSSFDFCQNTTQASMIGIYFNSPTYKLGSLQNNKNIYSNRGTTLSFNKANGTLNTRSNKNIKSQVNFKTIKSHYAENFKSKYSMFLDNRKKTNISEFNIASKNTIMDKLGDHKKMIREMIKQHYLSTEDFRQISPKHALFKNEGEGRDDNEIEGEEDNHVNVNISNIHIEDLESEYTAR